MNSARVGTTTFDFRKAMNVPRLVGIWRMMTDFRLAYFGATAALALSALAKTSMFILLGYFADRVMAQRQFTGGTLTSTLAIIAAAFVGLSAIEGGFAFLSDRLAAFTAEGITRRMRDFLFDHIQRLTFTYHSPHWWYVHDLSWFWQGL